MQLRDQLQDALGASYAIERELAGGGMSRVFVATDVSLGRRVVVKVLHPELAADIAIERFAREIQVVARLQQANIVPLLAAGRTADLPFYTMPFVEGLSLRQRLSDQGPLPVSEAIGVLHDVARALAYAHKAGVIHRDIKPENVLLSGGAAVVTDFGIAKAITEARTHDATRGGITETGVLVGTPAYMSPEQAAGDPDVDHRADIYAFGCLGYALLAGHPPFREGSASELLAAHVTRAPPPVATLRADAPPALAALVMRCLEKHPAQRPQSARELVASLESMVAPVASSTQFLSRRGRDMVFTAAAVAIVAAAGYLAFGRRGGASADGVGATAVAVIPFANVGGDSAQDYLADGLSDELATAVGKVPGVRLAARSGSYRYRGHRDLDVRDVGHALGVAYVVQGTVRRAGSQLRVSAQLTDASNGVELWSNNFDRASADIFRTQDDLAAAITDALVTRLGRRAAGAPALRVGADRRGTSDTTAYDLYLRAEYLLEHRQVDRAVETFQAAIARDPKFGRAYAGLSQALALMPYFSQTPTRQVAGRLRAAANTALVADSTLSEAYVSLGILATLEWKWDEARQAFERAIAINPNDEQAHFQFGRYLYYVGDDDRAFAEWNRVKAIDPFSALAAAYSASLLSLQGRDAEAVSEVRRAFDYDSVATVIVALAADVYELSGDRGRARELARRMPHTGMWLGTVIEVLARSGDPGAARAVIRDAESHTMRAWSTETSLGAGFLSLGDTARALDALERATDAHELWPVNYRVSDPIYDPIRRSARWAALIQRVGLSNVPGAVK